jgi:Flp pilus assembly protein TadG
MSVVLRRPRRDREGQVIVIFALALVAIVAAVGLVLDGGSTYAQRRSQQSAGDLAALAGANEYLLDNDVTLAVARARAVAAQNGYTHNQNGVTVDVSVATTNGAEVTVNITKPHANNFSSVVGMSTWDVSTTATAQSGYPDTVNGGGPMIFSIDIFGSNGQPLPQYSSSAAPYPFGEVNGDIPAAAGDLAWTNYGTGNLDTNEVADIIEGRLTINKTIEFGEYIGQHNNGNHTALYSSMNTYMSGTEIPVPIVDHNGNFQGWATFHVVSADGGSDKNVTGYFIPSFVNQRLSVGCAAGHCPRYLGSYVLKLTN